MTKDSTNDLPMLNTWIASKPTKFTNDKCYIGSRALHKIHEIPYSTRILKLSHGSSTILFKFKTWIKWGIHFLEF